MSELITQDGGEAADDELFATAPLGAAQSEQFITPVAHPALDMSFRRSAVFLTRQTKMVRLTLVGCGGTGSWVAAQVARTGRVLSEQGRRVQIVFVDADVVSAANVPRSCFCEQEIGELKAVALARRHSAAWALEIGSIPERFAPEMVRPPSNEDALNVLIGCVDNAAARCALAETLVRRTPYGYYDYGSRGQAVWIDCGNTREGGQVLLGSATRPEEMRECFKGGSICTALPSPAWQHPELLEELEEERADHHLSCAELMRRNTQSLMVNHFVASIAGDYLMRLLVTKNLRRFATYFDLEACSTRNRYITPDILAQVINCVPESLLAQQPPNSSDIEDDENDYTDEEVEERNEQMEADE